MTSTLAQGVGRSPGKSADSLPVLAASPALIVLLLAGLALRLTIAYALLPSSGFRTDLGSYVSWALSLAEHGPGGFYANAGFSDYPPAYLYLLWPIGMLARATADPSATALALLKIPPIALDLVVAYVIYRLARGWTWPGRRSERLALLGAGLYLLNPVAVYDSAVWGQSDAAGALVVLLGVAALIRGNSEGAAALGAMAALVKPQFGVVLIPLVAFVLVKRHLLRPGSGPRQPPWAPLPLAAWLGSQQGPVRIVTALGAGLVSYLVVAMPFGMGPFDYLQRMASTAAGYPWLTVNAFNPWALLGSGGDPALAQTMTWASDTVPIVGPVPGLAIGTALLVGGFLWGCARAALRDDRWTLLVAAAVLATAFFLLPTRVHERYLFPVFALLPLLAVAQRRWIVALSLMAAATFVNLHAVLTRPQYGTDNVVALPLGEWFRSPSIVTLSVLVLAGAGLWMAWQLRPSLRTSPDGFDAEMAGAGPGAAWTAALPAFASSGTSMAGTTGWRAWLDWLVTRLTRPPLRADRSASLAGERGGRIDSRDLLIVVGIIAVAILVRGYRLDQPVGMYFDEVYHARTATEFLQDWEYDQPHAIYEFTHPHLAKYAMAWGIRLAGDHRVHDTTALGVPVADAVIERRWSGGPGVGGRAGDRLYLATPDAVLAYDLGAREQEAVIPVAAMALAVDDEAHRLYLADPGGGLFAFDPAVLDERRERRSDGKVDASAETGLTSLSAGPGTPVERLLATQSVLVSVGVGALDSFDPETGAHVSHRAAFDTADLIGLPAAERLVIDPLRLGDRDAGAERLAGLLKRDAPVDVSDADDLGADPLVEDEVRAETERLRRLFEHDGPVVAGAYLADDVAGRIRERTEAGDLPGVSFEHGPLLAAATHAGVTILDARTLDEVAEVASDAPVTALTLVDGGLSDPKLYAASGDALLSVSITEDGPGVASILEMPGDVRDLAWNEPANLVHALGSAPEGGTTVYAVEPHGDAVFIDVPLPVEATRLLADTQPDHPADDRGELLAIDAAGTIVRVGSDGSAFGWRLPGMLLGALAAGLLYLLARVLFARRSVAIIAGVLVLAEGMLFANSRIGMNDVYVTTFLIAAALLFSPLYLSSRRPWTAVLLLLGTGMALGLALASKWVALYAVGGLALLVLFRSALGRVLALVGMVGLTALLGSMAVRSAAQEAPHRNWLFLGLALLLTALLAAAMVRRPLPFTRGEVRLAILGPIAAGTALVALGLLRSPGEGDSGAAGFLTPQLLLGAGALAVVTGAAVGVIAVLATRHGHGPFAGPRSADDGYGSIATVSAWLHPGRLLGVPWLFTLACLTLIPLVVYVVSYAPWVALGNQWGLPYIGSLPFMPGGDEGGRTLADLTRSMYQYHDELRAAHAASSPWWAWPLDLKPVWWFSKTYADGTSAYIYDAGNLVVFWFGLAGLAFGAWAAWTRRSLSLTVLMILWAVLWLPWARIDRATFQYHVYASLPFLVLALAYFLAELWHGPSARAWLLARVAGAIAIVGAPLLWLARTPLCILAGTAVAHPDGSVCAAQVTRTAHVSEAATAALAVLAVGAVAAALIGWWSTWSGRRAAADGPVEERRWPTRDRRWLGAGWAGRGLVVVAIMTAVGVVAALTFLDTTSPVAVTLSSDLLAVGALLLLGLPALLVLRARDARRFVLGVLGAAILWLMLWYPNLAALPLPSSLATLYQGILPTWNWDFQFAVNTDPAVEGGFLDAGTIVVGVTAALLVVGVSLAARWWGRNDGREPSSTQSAVTARG